MKNKNGVLSIIPGTKGAKVKGLVDISNLNTAEDHNLVLDYYAHHIDFYKDIFTELMKVPPTRNQEAECAETIKK